MRYRKINNNCTFTEFEDKDVDLAVINLFDTETGIQVYKNDIIRIDGIFSHTIWYNSTKRSSGKPNKTMLHGYSIYKVLEGGELDYKKLEILKSGHSLFSQQGNVYFGIIVKPELYNWEEKKSIKIIGNSHFSNIEELLIQHSI